MTAHRIGTRQQWRAARLELLEAETVLTYLGDHVAQRRQQLPWVPVDKDYVFDTEDGEKTLGDLFGERSQLLVYHFMFDPKWAEGCTGCSLMADGFDRTIAHLNRHDVTMLCTSRAPLARLGAYKRRMGWGFQWVSSLRNDFDDDFDPSVAAIGKSEPARNTERPWRLVEERAGLNAFALEGGVVYHTYSCSGRGLEAFNAADQLLDRAPRRNSEERPLPHARAPRRDPYDDLESLDPHDNICATDCAPRQPIVAPDRGSSRTA